MQLSAGFGDLLYDLGMVSQQERAVFRAYEVRMQACTHRWTEGWMWASPTSLRPPPHAGPPSTSSLHLLRPSPPSISSLHLLRPISTLHLLPPSQARIRAALDASNPLLAYRVFDEMLNGDEYPFPTYYANVTGMKSNYFNFEQGPDGSSLTTNHFIAWLGPAAGRPTHSRATCTRALHPPSAPGTKTLTCACHMRMSHARHMRALACTATGQCMLQCRPRGHERGRPALRGRERHGREAAAQHVDGAP